MYYRDFMQKFRPLYSPDDGSGGAAAATDPGAGSLPASGGEGAAAAPAEAAAAAVAAPDAGAAAAPQTPPESKPSLLEAAEGKPKPDAAAAKPAEGEAAKPDPAKDEKPAPAAAEKTDAEKAAEAKGDKPKESEKTEAEIKAEAVAAAATDPAAAATAEAQPPAPIKYDAFKLPDGIKLDDKELAKFTDIVGAAQVPQDVAQKIVDLYIADRGQLVQELRAEQRKTWDTLNDTWKTDLRKDPDLGGNRLETTLSMAKAVVEEFGGSPEQVRELLAHASNNGMGNFPGFVRLLHNIGQRLNVFEDSIVPANNQAPKMQKSPGNRGWYKDGGGGAAQ